MSSPPLSFQGSSEATEIIPSCWGVTTDLHCAFLWHRYGMSLVPFILKNANTEQAISGARREVAQIGERKKI